MDNLLAIADSNADGKLQIGEFLNWIFAADPKSAGLGLVTGDFSLVISGCSRKDVNGEYVQQSKFCSHRPVFYCSANKRFLFYWAAHQQWQLHKRMGSKSCARLKTSGPPHMESGWQLWKKKPGSLKSGFLTETSMTCSRPPPGTVEELLAKAAKAIYTNEFGAFLKLEKLFGDRPVYYNEAFGMWILYMNELQAWKMCYHEDGAGNEGQSGVTKGYSPDLSTWSREGKMMDVFAFDPEASLNTSVPDGWKDASFPHSVESLGKRFKDECEWVRALALSSSPKLFDKSEPTDACQGHLGDCWLIAAIAAVAEFPNYIRDEIFITKQASPDGQYKLQLFDWKEGKDWKVIEVDDYLPCFPRKKNEPAQKPWFAGLSDGEMYVPLLEKAFAKYFGSYEELHYGNAAMAFAALTGCTTMRHFGSYIDKKALTKGSSSIHWVVTARDGLTVRSKCDMKSSKLGKLEKDAEFEELERDCYRIMFKKISGEGPAEGWISYYRAGKKGAERSTKVQWGCSSLEVGEAFKKESLDDVAEMWPTLLEGDGSNQLMVAEFEFKSTDQNGRSWYGARPDGLMPQHVYSILRVAEIPGEVWEDPKRMVCLRNPWGRCEWKGPWKDQGDEWEAHPELQHLKYDNVFDGLFWMAWDDFEWCAERVMIVPRWSGAIRGDHEEEEDAGED